ncbi:hypothetical protein JOD52_001909 [Brachybacterium muris]|nr:hypothetical protein [Brachybacterium muris]
MVTQVRQRITRQLHGRRGTATDKVWASRQLLLTGYEHLTVKQKARFNAALAAEDPTNEIAEYSPRWGPLIEGSGATSLP